MAQPPPPPPPLPFAIPQTSLVVPQGKSYEKDESYTLKSAISRVAHAEKVIHPEPFFIKYTEVDSQLQEGPKCGLVALSIATSVTDNFTSADELLHAALEKGFTTQGEMYSCDNLAALTVNKTSFNAVVIKNGLKHHFPCILQCLMQGGLMLVPFDADRNHSPCCRGGKKAHWAVISGVVVFSELNDYASAEALKFSVAKPCNCSGGVFEFDTQRIKVSHDGVVFSRNGSSSKLGRAVVFLVGKQGKSRHWQLWRFEDLCSSNDNLTELSEEQKHLSFVLPADGVAGGLKGKAILITKKIL